MVRPLRRSFARRSLVGLCLVALVTLGGCARHAGVGAVAFAEQPYTVSTGDRLRIIVYGQDSLSNSYTVDASGNISMPLIGNVHVDGMTPETVQRAVETRLRNGYLRDPRVSTEVEAYRPFFILGEVTASGQYPFVNGMNVQTAVAIAGGFTPRANQSNAILTRVQDGAQVSGDVPLTQPVRPGDTIQIRERFF